MISIEVAGEPAPKGSYRAMMMRGRPIVVASSSGTNAKLLRHWERAIRSHVVAAIGERSGAMYNDVPLEVSLLFKLARPRSHFGKKGLLPSAPPHPTTKPDIDKLARSTLDALTGVLFDDDSRIAVLSVVKQWAIANSLAESGHTGVVITIRPVPPLQPRLL